jgi:tetratricopeptide (TPR) repeat protein
MADQSTVNELLLRWQELRDQGRAVSPEELCAGRPDLLDDLRRQVEALRSMERFLGTTGGTPPSAAHPEAPTVRAGKEREAAAAAGEVPLVGSRYRPLRLHARGGLGEVYLARDEELSRDVALKRLRRPHAADAGRRFLREGEITGGLEHPGVVPVYGLTRDADGQPCYAMRFIRGQTLQEAIARFHETDEAGRGLALRQLLGRFVVVCNTVAYAHSRGVVHRDLKPANIMLGDYGETLVVDWGLAKRAGAPGEVQAPGGAGEVLPIADRGEGGTATGEVLGTPAFMSPEQAAGRHDTVGPASDVYGLGATLYALLTGRPPFDGDGVAEVLRRVQRGDFPPPRQLRPDTPRPLEASCLKAMAREPAARYATALEMAADLERWLADEPVRAYREPWAGRARRWVRRHRTLVTTLAAVLLITALLGGGTAGWLAARQAETVHAARADLEEAERFQREEKWPDARTAVERAEARLGGGGPAELHEQARQVEANLALVDRLEEIVNDYTTPRAGENKALEAARAEEAYADAFARHGWDVADLDPEGAAQRIRASAIRDRLLTGLEQWAYFKGRATRPGGGHLLAVVAAVDPDPWRQELREAWVRRDQAAVSRLIVQADVPHMPTASVLALGRMAGLGDGSPEVIRVFKEAQRRVPEDAWTNLNLAYLLWNAKPPRKAEALGYYRAALVLRPGNTTVRLSIAGALIEQKAFQEAEAICQELLREKPNDAGVHVEMGWLHFEQGRLEPAAAEYLKALDLNPDLASAHQDLGRVRQRQGRLPEALTHYGEAIRLNYDQVARGHVNRAAVLLQMNEPADAEIACQTAIRAEPRSLAAHFFLGRALEAQNRLPEALAAYEAALRSDPGSDPGYAEAQTNIGYVLLNQGRDAQAEEALRKAIRLNPRLPEPRRILAFYLLRHNRLPEAEARAQEAIDLRPEDAWAHFTLGNILWKAAGQQEKAIGEFREALRLQPAFKEAAGNLAAALADLGRFDESLKVVRECPKLGAEWAARAERWVALDRRLPQVLSGKEKPTDEEQIEFADVCRRKRRYVAATEFFKAAFTADPKLVRDPAAGHRYHATCAAAMAARGAGEDVAGLDAEKRARLLMQAVDWLRADLDLWAARFQAGPPETREAVRQRLRQWRTEPDIGGLRNPASAAALPRTDQETWLRLWSDVEGLLQQP